MTRLTSALAGAAALAIAAAAAAPVYAQTADAGGASATTASNQDIVVVGRPQIGDFGVDLSARNLAVKPGDDFEQHASGAWIAATEIPADRPSVGSFYNLREDVTKNVQELIQSRQGTPYGALYASYMNEAALERAGLGPLMRDLARVRAISDKREFARFMGDTYDQFGGTLFGPAVYADTDNPELNVLWMGTGGLGLPQKDYYFKADYAKQRAAYQDYIERTMKALGHKDAGAIASRLMAFETELASLSWDAAQQRDITLVNNPMSHAELAAYAPGVDWSAFFEGVGIAPQRRMIVADNTAVKAFAQLYGVVDLETLKLWQELNVARQATPYLNKAAVDSLFTFTSSISGVSEQRPRWKRAVDMVDGSLGELVGEAYVAEYFPAIAKQRMEELVRNVKAAMGDRIRANAWMSPETKEAALEKLTRMDVMVGHPNAFRDYSALQVGSSLYDNAVAATKFNAAYNLEDLGKPVDRKKWAMNPQTVNAYNGGLENKMVFPAGILQPPFFDPYADPAVNYGAIGVVIGHEISHGFDDQGRKIDASGAVRDWWTAGDAQRFEAEAKKFGAQYAQFEVVPGSFINPELTMGENIADLAGVLVAYDAYKKSLGGQEAPVIDGLTGDQRFFLAYAQVWRAKAREDALRSQVTTDPHSPARYRTIAPLRNVDAWYAAFDVKPGDAMYLPPEERARIW